MIDGQTQNGNLDLTRRASCYSSSPLFPFLHYFLLADDSLAQELFVYEVR